MSKANVRREDRGTGADYVNQQRAVDEAMANKAKQERSDADVNRIKNRNGDNHKRDISQKKTGDVR
jgi:hypothetical protein